MSVQLRVLKGTRSGPSLVRRTLRVGELARRTGKTVRALHLYEEMGLLIPIDTIGGPLTPVSGLIRSWFRCLGDARRVLLSLVDLS